MAGTDSIALFEDRLILDARPPITDAELAAVAARCGRPVPAGLADLWRVSFGGRVDYDLRVDFDGEIARFSFTELFYPGSDGYRDLNGWIDHELELAGENPALAGMPLRYLPFGGFEYLDRLYVYLDDGPDHGAVFAWMQGLPPAWTLRLHSDSVARIADDVPSLFRLLKLEHDPFAPDADDLNCGFAMAEAIDAVAVTDAARADALRRRVRSAMLDWRAALAAGTIADDAQLRRLALEHAARTGDLPLIDRLTALGCDLQERFQGDGNILDHVLAYGHAGMAQPLIDRGVDPGTALISGAHVTPPDVVRLLLGHGAMVSAVAARSAAQGGLVESAVLMADALARDDREELAELGRIATDAASSAENDAARVAAGTMGSNRTPEQYRIQAAHLRELSAHCAHLLETGPVQGR